MNCCELNMQELRFLVALLENGPTSKQTCLQLLAAEHLYVPSLLPKLRACVKQAAAQEQLP